MRVLVTGDRDWTDGDLVKGVLMMLPLTTKTVIEETTIIHGAARGLDRIAAHHAAKLGFRVEPYPAQWKDLGRSAGPIRNQQMLDTGVDMCFAFHDNLHASKGTKDMVERCIKAGVMTALYGHKDGEALLITTWNWT